MPLMGALYIDGKKIMDVEEADFDSITIDPEEEKATINGIKRMQNIGPMEFTFTLENPRTCKRVFRKLEGWKNYSKPRYRMRKRAVKQMRKKNLIVVSAEDVRRVLRRWKEQMRRRALKAKRSAP